MLTFNNICLWLRLNNRKRRIVRFRTSKHRCRRHGDSTCQRNRCSPWGKGSHPRENGPLPHDRHRCTHTDRLEHVIPPKKSIELHTDTLTARPIFSDKEGKSNLRSVSLAALLYRSRLRATSIKPHSRGSAACLLQVLRAQLSSSALVVGNNFAMLGLSSTAPSGEGRGSRKGTKSSMRRAFKAVMRSHRFKLPKYDLPLRLRPVRTLAAATRGETQADSGLKVFHRLHGHYYACIGVPRCHQLRARFTTKRRNNPPRLSMCGHHLVLLHLRCRRVSHIVFVPIVTTKALLRDARRVWLWRHAPLILTAIFCFFFGGIISEVVQSLLPVELLVLLSILSMAQTIHQHQHLEVGDIAVRTHCLCVLH